MREADLQSLLPGATHRFVDIAHERGAVRLHVAELGAGEPILLLHGWPQHWYAWRHVANELASTYRLVMPDLRGFGWSGTPGDGYDADTFAADIVALLDALGLARVNLVGHDWGGFTAFLLGIAHPERFRRIVVFNAPPPWAPLTPALMASMWRTWYVTAVASPLGPRMLARPRFIPWFIRLGGRHDVFSDQDADVYARQFQEPERGYASRQLYRSYLRVANDVFLHRRYRDRSLTVPTRVLFSSEDFYLPEEYFRGYENNATQLYMERISGCGHFLPEERPELASKHIREHVES